MPQWLKVVLAVLMLPLCWGAFWALMRLLRVTGYAESFWVAWLGGIACWCAIYLLLPRPMLVYVFGHELTHVIWAWLFGGKVKRFKVSAKGGHVLITRSNFLVALAPYFFPLYGVLVVVIFGIGHQIWNWEGIRVWFHWLVGVSYGFHITLTFHVLKSSQSDITSQGWFFSVVIIFLGNMLVLLVGIPLLTPSATVAGSLGWWLQESGAFLSRLRW